MIYGLITVAFVPVAFLIFTLIIHRELQRVRKRNKELERLNTAKDKLLTVIGHDLNGTLTSLQPALEFYNAPDTPPEEKDFLFAAIEEKIYFASSTLQSLLNWGKLQLKGITINPTKFNAADIIKSKLDLIKVVAQNKGLTVINALPPTVDIYADENQFRFILRNLLSNAIKFSRPAGTIEIDILKGRRSEFTVFSLRDSGMGIGREKLKQIFQPFNESTEGTSNEKGNGIGLMLCKEYAQENGGDIWAESEDKIGTIFYLALKSSNHSQSFRPYPLKTESYGNKISSKKEIR